GGSVRQGYGWTVAGCEVGMYPYVIPFSGAAMSRDPAFLPDTVYVSHQEAGTEIAWHQPSKILPRRPDVRAAIVEIELEFETKLSALEQEVAHLPSRVRSLLWVLSSAPVLARLGRVMPDADDIERQLFAQLPLLTGP